MTVLPIISSYSHIQNRKDRGRLLTFHWPQLGHMTTSKPVVGNTVEWPVEVVLTNRNSSSGAEPAFPEHPVQCSLILEQSVGYVGKKERG